MEVWVDGDVYADFSNSLAPMISITEFEEFLLATAQMNDFTLTYTVTDGISAVTLTHGEETAVFTEKDSEAHS